MSQISANSGDLSFQKVVSQQVGGDNPEFQKFREQLYLLVSTMTIKGGAVTTADLANNAVTFAKMQQISTDSLLGRDTAGTGNVENILLNSTLSMDGSGNLQRAALTGAITAPAGSNVTSIGTALQIPSVGLRYDTTPTNQTAAITRVSQTATYTLNSHGFSSGDYVQIDNANQAQYNGWFQITVTGVNTFTYTVTGSPATPSTGTSRVDVWLDASNSWGLSLISNVNDGAAGVSIVTFTNTQTDAFYQVMGTALSTALNNRVAVPYSNTTTGCNIGRSDGGGAGEDGAVFVHFYGII